MMYKNFECKIIPDDDLQSVIGGGMIKTVLKAGARRMIYIIVPVVYGTLFALPSAYGARHDETVSKFLKTISGGNLSVNSSILGDALFAIAFSGAAAGALLGMKDAEYICKKLGLE